tara:strand:+ start:991 stop:1326 length:336 start_codon:yes stop_codon:yes gene_type:complete
MAHFAEIVDGIVQQVIVAEQDFVDTQEGTWVQTSYNTHGGVHWTTEEVTETLGGQTITSPKPVPSGGAALRKNYAGIGDTYDAERDAFYAPQPSEGTWTFNEDTCLWVEVE